MWYFDEKTGRLYSAQFMFVPLHEDKVCPACENPEHQWKEVELIDP
jgi:hypothetical protein